MNTNRAPSFAGCLLVSVLGLFLVVALLYLGRPLFARFLWQRALQSQMHCWVKVVNQDGEGVKGYKCQVVEEHAPVLPFSRVKEVVRIFETDQNGMFEFTSKGAAGRVFFENGWGQQWKLNPRHLIDFHGLGLTSLDYQRDKLDRAQGPLGTKENPYIIHVFSLGPPQRLLYSKAIIKLESREDYFCIDILNGKTWESNKPEGDIAMADYTIDIPVEISSKLFHNEQHAIRFIGGPNCEVAPVLDEWGLGPPSEGYCLNLEWPDCWNERPESKNRLKVYYRVRKKGDSEWFYGVLRFVSLHKVNGSTIECFTNLQGERNLYFTGYEGSMRTFDLAPIRDYVSPPVQ